MAAYDPGARGWLETKLTALTTPPELTAGVELFGCKAPPMDAFPFNAGLTSCACAVIVTVGSALLAFHVAVQRPSSSDCNDRAGSPDENVTVTLPFSSGFPQSSTTVTSIAVGQPAVELKPVPSRVKTGISLAGRTGGHTRLEPRLGGWRRNARRQDQQQDLNMEDLRWSG